MRTLLLLLLAAPLALAQLPKPEPADMRIEGVVADALSGAPVAGARVEFMGSHVDGDTAGRFRFDGLGPGTYNLRVRGAGYLQADQQVVLNAGQTSATLRIALTPGAAIESARAFPAVGNRGVQVAPPFTEYSVLAIGAPPPGTATR